MTESVSPQPGEGGRISNAKGHSSVSSPEKVSYTAVVWVVLQCFSLVGKMMFGEE